MLDLVLQIIYPFAQDIVRALEQLDTLSTAVFAQLCKPQERIRTDIGSNWIDIDSLGKVFTGCVHITKLKLDLSKETNSRCRVDGASGSIFEATYSLLSEQQSQLGL